MVSVELWLLSPGVKHDNSTLRKISLVVKRTSSVEKWGRSGDSDSAVSGATKRTGPLSQQVEATEQVQQPFQIVRGLERSENEN